MKNLKKITALFALTVGITLLSCKEDDDMGPIIPGPPTGSEIKYKLDVSADIITEISYRTGTGNTFYGNLLPDSRLSWYNIIVLPFWEMPATAYVQAKFLNNTDTEKTYTFEIYQDTTLVKTSSGVILPADDDPETNDVVTKSTSIEIDRP